MRRGRAKYGAYQVTSEGRGNHKGKRELQGKYFVISAKRIINAHRGQVKKVLTIIHVHDYEELSLKGYLECVIMEIGLG